MKIVLICPSNITYMPYINNYINILKESNIDYIIINWDRNHIEDINNKFVYRDKKIGHRRNYFHYFLFKKFIISKLNGLSFDKIIVFGLQLGYFLNKYLIKFYSNKYILDIRDYNKIIKFTDIKKLINNSNFVAISSSGYKSWLPFSEKYIINHNTNIRSINELDSSNNTPFNDAIIKISSIGFIRDYEISIKLINKIKNCENIKLNFYGEGLINNDLINYIKTNDVNNVIISGIYSIGEEEALYRKSDIINLLIDNSLNSKTCLANRLYNSVKHGKPLLAFGGTYISQIIKSFNLGLVVDSLDNIETKIINYTNTFNNNLFNEGRIEFINKVIDDNDNFIQNLKQFISS